MGAKITNAITELNTVKKIPPRGDTKNATIPTNVRIVDVSSFNSEAFPSLLLLFPSPPGGKNMDRDDTDVVVVVVDEGPIERCGLYNIEDRIILFGGRCCGSCRLLAGRCSMCHR